MHQFFVEASQIHDKTVIIEGSDVNHIKNVLRMKIGEELSVSNGVDGREYRCGIVGMEENRIVCELRFVKEDGVELSSKVYLFQGLPKADKMELIIQKAVELGVYEIIPVSTKRAVVKLDEKKEESKRKRWNAICESAAKQSKRMRIPKVTGVMSFREALEYGAKLDVKLIPYELAQDMEQTRRIVDGILPGQSVGIFIGPEGGFEESEVGQAREAGFSPVTLGRRILRTETAGLALLAALMFRLEE